MLPYYCHKIRGTGQQAEILGRYLWDVKEYTKASLRELIVGGQLEPYREMPQAVMGVFGRNSSNVARFYALHSLSMRLCDRET